MWPAVMRDGLFRAKVSPRQRYSLQQKEKRALDTRHMTTDTSYRTFCIEQLKNETQM